MKIANAIHILIIASKPNFCKRKFAQRSKNNFYSHSSLESFYVNKKSKNQTAWAWFLLFGGGSFKKVELSA
jgi:hypothetical protein